MSDLISFDDFIKIDIRVGTIIEAKIFKNAKKPAYKLLIDIGEEIGIKKSSAQISELYSIDELLNKQVLCVVNFHPKQIANFMSEVLVLGIYSKTGVVLVQPEQAVQNGERLV